MTENTRPNPLYKPAVVRWLTRQIHWGNLAPGRIEKYLAVRALVIEQPPTLPKEA